MPGSFPLVPLICAQIPAWGLWAATLIGLGGLVFAVVRNSRRLARGSADDAGSLLPGSAGFTGSAGRATATDPADPLRARAERQIAELRELVSAADRRIEELRSLSRANAGRTAGAPRAPRAAGPGSASDDESVAPNPADRVFALADEGLTPMQIAAETGRSVSEISLILALR
ncbi:MAG: hypothetical protein AB7K52_04375 [Phycisphaerales bacterium]